MDPYGMDSEQGSTGSFFDYNKMMNEMSKPQATKHENTYSRQTTNLNAHINRCNFFQTGIKCVFFSCKCKSYPIQNQNTPETINPQNLNKVQHIVPSTNHTSINVECTYVRNGKSCMNPTCNHCQPQYERISSLSPVRNEKSVTPVRDEPPLDTTVPPPIVNGDGRECSYFRKGLPCPFPACKYKCYDIPERLPVVAKRIPSPNADPNVKLCDYYKYDRPCPFPRCTYKCYDSAEKQKHFEMGYIKPITNKRRHAVHTDHRNIRDVDHRKPGPPRRDSWEAKCDEFIMNMFESKPSVSPTAEDEATTDHHLKKSKSHEKEDPGVSPKKRSKKKRSHDRDDENDNSPSKRKKSKKDKKEKKEKKSKKSKKERSKHEKVKSVDPDRNKNESTELEDVITVNSSNTSANVSVEIETNIRHAEEPNEPSSAFVDFIIKNFRKSSKKKLPLQLQMEGLFKCEEKEVAKFSVEDTKIEWITRKTLEFLDASGYNEDKIYDVSTLMDGETLEKQLKNVVYDAVKLGKIGHSKNVISQLFHVIELVVKYYIGSDETEDEDEAIKEKPENKPPGFNTVGDSKTESVEIEKPLEQEKHVSPEQSKAANNPWADMAKSIQSEDLKSFQGVKRSLAKSLLASGNKNGFEVAYEMIECWCNADYNLPRLKILVSKRTNENIFPPKVPIEMNSKEGVKNVKKFRKIRPYLFDNLVENLRKFKGNLNEDQIEFCVRKTIMYILVGTEGSIKGQSRFDEWKASCEPTKRTKKNQSTPNLPPSEIVYNYLPPGLREEESTDTASQITNGAKPSESSSGSPPSTNNDTHLNDDSTEFKERGDHINEVPKNQRLPKRKYIIGSVFVEWECIEGGRPEVFEISVYFPNMGNLTLHLVTKTMQGHPELLKENGFVIDPDVPNKYYVVQKGCGFSETMFFREAIDTMVNYLEGKRNATGENENNGIILLFRGYEELAVIARSLEWAGHHEVMLDVVKGFGTLETVIESLGSGEFIYRRPTLASDETKEAFFTTNITTNSSIQCITSKNKAESLHQALELFLGMQPSYENFVQRLCFPSFSHETKQSKHQMRKLEEFYFFERYFAANCKSFFSALRPVPETNVCGEFRSKRCNEESDVFAYRICKSLVQSGLHIEQLKKSYKDSLQHTLSANVLLSKSVIDKIGEDKTDIVVRFCNEKLQNFFVQM